MGRPALESPFDRSPPFDPEAEISVLGSIMFLPTVLEVVSTILKPSDFLDEVNCKIYQQLLAMKQAGRPIDPVLLTDQLREAGQYESIGGPAYIARIMDAVSHAANALYYAEIVRDNSLRRAVIQECTEYLRRAYDGTGEAVDLITDAGNTFSRMAITGSAHRSKLIGDVATDTVAEIAAAICAKVRPGIYTGILSLDSAIGPMMPGELVILAARPGCGKTSLAMQIAKHTAKRRGSVLFASLEMRDRELVSRELCQIAGIDSRDVRSGRLTADQLAQLNDAAESLQGVPLPIWDPARATIPEIRSEARRLKATTGLALMVVDYLGLIRATPEDRRLQRYEQVAGFTSELKAIAKELEIPVIVLCQLNREADGIEPKLCHLRESGSIEQDADTVLFIYHPQQRVDRSPNEGPELEAHVLVGKHRHSETGFVRLIWVPQLTAFFCAEGV